MAFAFVAAQRRGAFQGDALDHGYTYPTLACPSALIGEWALYQGRFKSFPVQTDEHFFVVPRYVERNALRAKLVSRAEQWQWSSLYRFVRADGNASGFLNEWPMERPKNWIEFVNGSESELELDDLRSRAQRGRPFGSEDWVMKIAKQLGLESTMNARGRPKRT